MSPVERIVSGQTIEIVDPQKQTDSNLRVQLIGVSAPDLRQRPWGEIARERLQEMIGEKPVLLEFDVELKDQFDRHLAYVWQNGKLLNEQLLLEGRVMFRSRSLNRKYDQRLERAQEHARVMGLGIWNPDQALRVSPEQFRQQHR
jgi:micrococcal nuclease